MPATPNLPAPSTCSATLASRPWFNALPVIANIGSRDQSPTISNPKPSNLRHYASETLEQEYPLDSSAGFATRSSVAVPSPQAPLQSSVGLLHKYINIRETNAEAPSTFALSPQRCYRFHMFLLEFHSRNVYELPNWRAAFRTISKPIAQGTRTRARTRCPMQAARAPQPQNISFFICHCRK